MARLPVVLQIWRAIGKAGDAGPPRTTPGVVVAGAGAGGFNGEDVILLLANAAAAPAIHIHAARTGREIAVLVARERLRSPEGLDVSTFLAQCIYMDVGIRELKQRLSEYLDRVAKGERLRVTDRGRPKALIIPLVDVEIVDRGVREGWIVRGDQSAPQPVPRVRARRRTLEVLADDRGAE